MTLISRRDWLAFCAGSTLAVPGLAIEPIERPGRPHLKLSLAAYSFHRALNLQSKPKPSMTLYDFIDFAAEYETDAVELTAYFFPETTPAYLASLKRRCTRLGLDISGTAVGNDFCHPDTVSQEVQKVKTWIEHTARLGGKTMRIFAGSVRKGDGEDQALARCVAAIQEACDWAARFGIYLALENHGGITATADQMLAIVKQVKHDHFGVNLDTGNFHSDDPYAELTRIAPYAVNVQLKTEMTPRGKPAQEADIGRLIDILRKAGYRGYVALEYEAREDPRTAVPRYLKALRKALSA